MAHHFSCFVIRVTPRGRGAVASIMLVGGDAFAVLESRLVFPQSWQKPTSRKYCENDAPVFAYFQLGNSCEEVVLNFRRHDMIELHCHGGDTVVNAIENVLVESGAEARTWQNWLLETRDTEFFYHGSLDVIQREAVQLLPLADTELTAKLLLAQYHGALSRRINQLNDLLADNAVHEAVAILDSLLASYESGRHLTTPFRVGLIGPVNVGKSSLMNALVGFNRSITSQIAGTTRDAVSAKTVVAGWSVMLIDTAGIRETSNPIEQEGISRMQTVMTESDFLLSITDACDVQTVRHPQIIDIASTTPVLHVVNKIDLVDDHTALQFRDVPDTVPVSALTGMGLDQLNEALINKLHTNSDLVIDKENLSQTALVFTERQYAQLSDVRKMLENGDISAVTFHSGF